MRIKIAFLAALCLCFSLGALADTPAPAGTLTPPDQVVEQTAHAMLQAIASKHAELKQHPQQLYQVIGNILLPHFDFDQASRIVLGQYWRNATPAQRKAFEDAFYKYLIHSYANGMLQGKVSDHDVRVEPWHGSPSDTRAMVRSQVTRGNGAPPVQVDYAMVRTPEGWKAFDVTIEGISYVMNYRNQFGPEIQAKGLDELIQRLNAETEAAPAPQGSGS